MPRKRVINWNNDFDYGTGPDGTNYLINSETVRYEGKWWWADYAEADTFGPGGVSKSWKHVPVGDCEHTKMSQVARCERYARQRLKESSQCITKSLLNRETKVLRSPSPDKPERETSRSRPSS